MTNASPDASPPQIIALVRDLMFSSRIANAAKQLSTPVRMLRNPPQLADAGGKKLIVDLNQDGAIAAAAAWRQATGGVVIGFVSHVDVETINRAREAGVDQVMARSQFVNLLPSLLTS